MSFEIFITKPSVLHSFLDSTAVVNINTEKILALKIFPNPTNEILNIEGDFDFFEIFSNLGQRLFESKKSIVEIKNLSAGIYSLKIYKNNEFLKVYRFEKL